MGLDYISPEFEVIRNYERCISCRICEKQCPNGVHIYDKDAQILRAASTASAASPSVRRTR